MAESLVALADRQLEAARAGKRGRSASTVYGGGGHALSQTVMALVTGQSLAEHESPGEATLQVLHGRVRLVSGERAWDGAVGDLLVIPEARHALEALEDAVVLLTVAKRP